ncbi:MAG: hypothetical protein Ct9H90mP26_0300 [Methanobacteriota archaeon]|nr:MAG: hypothetical protein Ct9H90mP26_0300 [Euryarchaeota archaeon]
MEAGLYGAPIILGMTLVDPTMGEVKRKMRDLRLAIISGLVVSYWCGLVVISGLVLI